MLLALVTWFVLANWEQIILLPEQVNIFVPIVVTFEKSLNWERNPTGLVYGNIGRFSTLGMQAALYTAEGGI